MPSRRPQHAEGARQVGPLAGSSSPSRRRHQHVELPGLGSRAMGSSHGEHDVGAVLGAIDHRHDPGPERGHDPVRGSGGRRRAHDAAGPTGWIPCSSCRETTFGSPAWAERIARAAAIPPEIVVMQAMPRVIAAERIS